MRSGAEDQVESCLELILMRHGVTGGNQQGRYIGRTDEALSIEGIASLSGSGNQSLLQTAQILLCSPMKRCLQTGGLLCPGQIPVTVEAWREIDFGDWEGRTYEELKDVEEYRRWLDSGGTLCFPGGESREAFSERCAGGLLRVVKELIPAIEKERAIRCRRAAAIVHGGTIMALLSRFAGGDYFSWQCKNAEGYFCRLFYDPNGIKRLEVCGKCGPDGDRKDA